MAAREKMLRLTLPFYPERVLKVLKTVKKIHGPRTEVLKFLEKEWYTRMAETYFNYCKYWDLITIEHELCKLTPLGDTILQLYEARAWNLVSELIYYAFVNSKEFATLRIIVRRLFEHLERYGAFEFTNEEIPSRFVSELRGRHDISDLTSVFWKAKILRRERRGRKLVYLVDYYSPTLGSFALSLFHYLKSRKLRPPHSIMGFEEFRAFWFLSMDHFIEYLRRCRARGWISYQEYADINQFHFNINSLTELTRHIIQAEVRRE